MTEHSVQAEAGWLDVTFKDKTYNSSTFRQDRQQGLSPPRSNSEIIKQVFDGRRNAPDTKFTNVCIDSIMNMKYCEKAQSSYSSPEYDNITF